jgi:hypothetical protein
LSCRDDETVKRTGGGKQGSAEVALVPDADHCIESVARNEYRRGIDACLRLEGLSPELEARMEILQRFLEQADFHRLRRESEPFIRAGRRVRFLIGLDGEQARWRIEAETTEEKGQ